jgi:hypothetical protein
MAIKLSRGQSVRWHWQHILREFGLGEQSVRANVQLTNTTRYALFS